MVEKARLMEQLRKLKRQIQEDPEVKARYDLDGDGEISGEEWDRARKATIAYLEAEEARADSEPSPTDDVADRVYGRLRAPAEGAPDPGSLMAQKVVIIQQLVEGIEMITDLEGRNKYKLFDENQRELAHAEEAQTGVMGALTRNLFSGRRPFEMSVTGPGIPGGVIWLKRKFEWFFSCIDVLSGHEPVGRIQQRFAILSRKYDLEPYLARRTLNIHGPLFHPWTFHVRYGERQVALIEKKWSGVLKEAFTRADTFKVTFEDPSLTQSEKKLILGAAIAIDIDYFEQSQKSN